MREYPTVSRPTAIRGALRALDLLGQLPVREPWIDTHDLSHDFRALRDDWRAIGEDLAEATERMQQEVERSQPNLDAALHAIHEQLDLYRKAAEEDLAEATKTIQRELNSDWPDLDAALHAIYEHLDLYRRDAEKILRELEGSTDSAKEPPSDEDSSQMPLFEEEHSSR